MTSEVRPGSGHEILSTCPTDAWSVKEYGLQEWLNEWSWPISDLEFDKIVDELLVLFDVLYGLLGERDRDILLAGSGFIFQCAQILHAHVVRERFQAMGKSVLTGRASRPFYEAEWRLGKKTILSTGMLSQAVFRFKGWLKRVKFNSMEPLAMRIAGDLFPSECWSLGSWSRLKADYCASRGVACSHHYAETILPLRWDPVQLGSSFEEGLATCCAGIGPTVQRMCGLAPDTWHMMHSWLDYLSELGGAYEGVLRTGKAPRILLLTETANPLHKAVSLALRRMGTRVVGFHHGNDVVNSWEKQSAYVESAHCDEFACPTEAMSRFHRMEYDMAGISRYHHVEFTSVETGYYAELRDRCSRLPLPRRVHTVMIMGYPMNAQRAAFSAADFSLFQLEFEHQAARLLKGAGFGVLYKVHPERRAEAEGLFKGVCDETIADPFEKVWDRADAYLFGCTTSTTFGFAQCLNRYIAVLDFQNKRWNPEAHEFLKRRCAMIPADLDDRNRIVFDGDCLVQAFSKDLQPPDFTYVNRFMLP